MVGIGAKRLHPPYVMHDLNGLNDLNLKLFYVPSEFRDLYPQLRPLLAGFIMIALHRRLRIRFILIRP